LLKSLINCKSFIFNELHFIFYVSTFVVFVLSIYIKPSCIFLLISNSFCVCVWLLCETWYSVSVSKITFKDFKLQIPVSSIDILVCLSNITNIEVESINCKSFTIILIWDMLL